MIGKLLKAIAGCLIGGITLIVLRKYGASFGLAGSVSGIDYASIVSSVVFGVLAYVTKGKETVGTIMAVACAFNVGAIITTLVNNMLTATVTTTA